jgi:hypothetical protein
LRGDAGEGRDVVAGRHAKRLRRNDLATLGNGELTDRHDGRNPTTVAGAPRDPLFDPASLRAP